jgi:hypothetical protein
MGDFVVCDSHGNGNESSLKLIRSRVCPTPKSGLFQETPNAAP